MARIRTIKPEFFRHLELYKLEIETKLPIRVAFAGLWTSSDREGRFKWEPETLKLDCLPFDSVDFSRVLDALLTRGFIEKYTSDNREFGFIPSWHDHQVINNRETESKLPIPTESNTLTRDGRVDDATGTRLKGKGREGKGKEGKGIPAKDVFLDYLKTIPEYPFEKFQFAVSAKYDTWVSDGWRDGNGKPIKDWEAKLRNTLPYLKPVDPPQGSGLTKTKLLP